MSTSLRLGVMMTLDDHHQLHQLDVDFFELLIREQDDVEKVEEFLHREERCAIVHAPEKMRINGRSMLIDLADENLARRDAFVRRINDISAMAGRYDVATVIHPGGVRPHSVGPEQLHGNLAASLASLDGKIWLENMPRRYHIEGEKWWCNIGKHPHEFVELLPHVDGITLDISHAYLSVENSGNDAISSFFQTLDGHIKHIHLSDAAQPDGEGLQLGDGDVDLPGLPHMHGLPVLLEIWEGHRNGGAGYIEALRRIRSSDHWFRGCAP